jgi:hypothetical protein
VYDTLVTDLMKKRHRWSWAYLHGRRIARYEYMKLWKLHKQKKSTGEQEARLEQLENDWDVDDILLFRSLADALLMREKKQEEAEKSKKVSRRLPFAYRSHLLIS